MPPAALATQSTIIVTVNDRVVRDVLKAFPKITNAESNKRYNQTVRQFMLAFARHRLIRGVFEPIRKVNIRKPRPGQPNIGKASRKAGFKAVLYGRHKLEGKAVRVRTSNPLLLIHEYPRPVFPKHGRYMILREFRTARFPPFRRRFTGSGSKRRRQAWYAGRQRARGNRYMRWEKPVVARILRIKPQAPLRFYASWRMFRGQADQILRKIPTEVVRRAQLIVNRRMGRTA